MEPIIFEIKNFQSIRKALIKINNFTVFVGPTDLGKTAIVRALKSILYNDWNPSFLTYGEKECVLSLTFPEDSTHNLSRVVQVKTKTKNEYHVFLKGVDEPKVYPKVGRDTPDELKALGFTLVETDRGDNFNLNFQTQLEPLFLVLDSEVALTSFVNKIFDISLYESILKAIRTDQQKLTRDYDGAIYQVEVRNNELITINAERDLIVSQKEIIENFLGKISEKEKHIQFLEEGLGLIEERNACIQELEDYSQILTGLNLFKEFIFKIFNGVSKSIELHKYTELLLDKKIDFNVTFRKLKYLNFLKTIFDKYFVSFNKQAEILFYLNQISEITSFGGILAKERVALFYFKDSILNPYFNILNKVSYINVVSLAINKLDTLSSLLKYTQILHSYLKDIFNIFFKIYDSLFKVSKYDSFSRNLEIQKNQLAYFVSEVEDQTLIKEEFDLYIHQIKDELGTCPICQKPFNE